MTTTATSGPAGGDRSGCVLTAVSRADGARCAHGHFGTWSIEPRWFQSAVDAIRSGAWKPRAGSFDDDDSCDAGDEADPLYVVSDGVAVVTIDGQMTKGGSSFGGCSTVRVRRALRLAAADQLVRAVVLHVCSPGGTCAGTGDLADDVRAVREGTLRGGGRPKRVVAYAADMCCSAAYWVASQCEAVYANATAMVGSIGTYTVLSDYSAEAERWGVKYTVVSTGPYKGLGADGKVTPELVADVQREVNELNAVFLAAVKSGRGDRLPDLAAVSDGRAYAAEQARGLGLVDAVMSLDDVIDLVAKSAAAPPLNQTTPGTAGGTPGPNAGKLSAAPGGERTPMDPKKRAYLESIGLRTDASEEQATQFYDLLSPERQQAADDAVTAEAADPAAPAPAPGASAPAAAAAKPATLAEIVAACDGDKAYAFDAAAANMTAEQARAGYGAVRTAKASAAEKDKEIARLQFAAGGQKALATTGGKADEKPDADPETAAKAKALTTRLGSNLAAVAAGVRFVGAGKPNGK